MNIMVVDDERLIVDNLLSLLQQVEPEAETIGFTEPEDAFIYLAQNQVDIIFMDIEMGEWNGIALAKRCKDVSPHVNVIFVTGYPEYTMEAFKLRVSGYLIKPVSEEDLRVELDNLRNPLPPATSKRVRIQTFGNFEIFVDGRPLHFPRTKCRECLAYLVDRKGAMVTIPELAAVLWDDKPYDRATQNRVYQILYALTQTLKKAGVADIIVRNRKEIAINPEHVDCDYYAAIGGDMMWMNTFTGEYMSNYGWAEFTLGELIHRKI